MTPFIFRLGPSVCRLRLVMVLWTVTAGIGCTVLEPAGDSFVLVSYNVENLFDAGRDGTEYIEFTPEGGWTRQKVEDRLQRLGDALGKIRPTPDVIVLTEVENNSILDDLFRRYVVDVSYPYRVFSSHPLGATGVAVASRYPVTDVRVFQPRAESETPVRPVLEVRLQLADTAVVVFANHWKSKRGSAPATEQLRRAAAALLASRLAVLGTTEPELPMVVCGDLNEEPREGEYIGFSYPTALLPAWIVGEWCDGKGTIPSWFDGETVPTDCLFIADTAEEATELAGEIGSTVLVDGWNDAAGDGSYWYFGSWEQIDHILVNPVAVNGPVLSRPQFSVVRSGMPTDSSGRPVSWFDDSDGVSDHLPVMMEWKMNRN